MGTFTDNEPLSDGEFDRLEDFLKSCKGGKAMNVEELDGFFAALIAGPENVMPSSPPILSHRLCTFRSCHPFRDARHRSKAHDLCVSDEWLKYNAHALEGSKGGHDNVPGS
jgi:yecA family protein